VRSSTHSEDHEVVLKNETYFEIPIILIKWMSCSAAGTLLFGNRRWLSSKCPDDRAKLSEVRLHCTLHYFEGLLAVSTVLKLI
jgi:hypothetical protein